MKIIIEVTTFAELLELARVLNGAAPAAAAVEVAKRRGRPPKSELLKMALEPQAADAPAPQVVPATEPEPAAEPEPEPAAEPAPAAEPQASRQSVTRQDVTSAVLRLLARSPEKRDAFKAALKARFGAETLRDVGDAHMPDVMRLLEEL